MLRRTLTCSLGLVLVSLIAMLLAAPLQAACGYSCIDINQCGPPFTSGCTYPTCEVVDFQEPINLGCCATNQDQLKQRRFYDCTGDGNADCELRYCYPVSGQCSCAPPSNPCPTPGCP